MILASSASVMLLIMCSCTSGSRNANTSAASSLGSIRNTMTFGLSSSSPRNSAISASFISERRARSSRNFRSCIYCINSSASYCSIDPILSFEKKEPNTNSGSFILHFIYIIRLCQPTKKTRQSSSVLVWSYQSYSVKSSPADASFFYGSAGTVWVLPRNAS